MTGVSRFTDMVAGAVFGFLLQHQPKKQFSSGNKYLDRAVQLYQESLDILETDDKKQINKRLQKAREYKTILAPQVYDNLGLREKLVISHKYKTEAKGAYGLTEDLSNLRRILALTVADAIVDVAERNNVTSTLDETANLEDLHLAIVNTVDPVVRTVDIVADATNPVVGIVEPVATVSLTVDNSSPTVVNRSASYSSVVEIAQMAEEVWAMPRIAQITRALGAQSD